MELIIAVLLCIGAVLGAVVSRLLADEYKAWSPRLVERLLRRAVRGLPADQRERYDEEWRSHVGEVPGEIGKLIVAAGFLLASRKMTVQLREGYKFARAKRIEDLVLSCVLLSFYWPSMLIMAALVRFESPGPALVRVPRYSFDGRVILVYKFRTTNSDGETTHTGRFLEARALDNLPQIINVFLGDMSVVGPRPYEVHPELEPRDGEDARDWRFRRNMKPGITGWAQINGLRGELNSRDELLQRIQHDIFYVRNWSIVLDLRILLTTMWMVIRDRNKH